MTSREFIRVNSPKWYLALLRVFMGYFYLHVGYVRFLSVRADADILKTRLASFEANNQFAWFQWYFGRVIDPARDSGLLTILLAAAPILLGASLVLGLFTRASSVLGALLLVHVFLIEYTSADALHLLTVELQFAALMTICFAAAGRTLGIDGIFWRHRILATYVGEPDPRWSEPRVPAAKDLPPIPLSENKPSLSGRKTGYDIDEPPTEPKPKQKA